MEKPLIGITMGDAAGVGPEIIMKALSDPQIYEISKPVVIGDVKMLQRAESFLKTGLLIKAIQNVEEAEFKFGVVNCIDLNLLPIDLPYGRLSEKAGDAAFKYLKKAIELAKDKKIDAISTAPLNKEALHKAGYMYPGQTEILAKLTNTTDFAMMLSAPRLKVIHVTTHVGLVDAVKMINPERIYTVIKLAYNTLKKVGYSNPRIAVCGINPHAGENGLFGYGEEEEKIVPAIQKAQTENIKVTGPLPADTVFFRAIRGEFDIVVVMYHDQGHIPIKVLGFETGVNITVGLPFIRTSVDHGTAFDIAGKGIADEKSMKEAICQAAEFTSK